MFALFIILLSLAVINAILLLVSLHKVNSSTERLPELYALNKTNKKPQKQKEVPTYSIYKKAM